MPDEKETKKLEKGNCYTKVARAVKAGIIKKPKSCPKCGNTVNSINMHAHHHNGYSDALDITWLCAWCHKKEHPKLPNPNKKEKIKRPKPIPSKKDADKFMDTRVNKLGLTKAELARQMNVHVTTITNYETGATPINDGRKAQMTELVRAKRQDHIFDAMVFSDLAKDLEEYVF